VRDERASKLLLRALAEGNLPTRMRAVEALAELKTPEVIEQMRLTITDDQESFVRRLAVAAYADAVGRTSVPTLLLALQDDDAWVREDTARQLEKVGDTRAIPALQAALADPNTEAATAIRDALAALQALVKK
jgi:HEAT repeat protein